MFRYKLIIGYVNNIPTMQFYNGIARDNQSKSYTLSSGNSEIMPNGILINMPIHRLIPTEQMMKWCRDEW